MTAGSSGCDIAAAIDADIVLMPGNANLFHVFCFEIPPGFRGAGRSRSGLAAKHGVMVLNSQAPSTPITVANQSHPHQPRKRTIIVRRGDRIAQVVPMQVASAVDFKEKTGIRRRSGEPEVSGIRGVN